MSELLEQLKYVVKPDIGKRFSLKSIEQYGIDMNQEKICMMAHCQTHGMLAFGCMNGKILVVHEERKDENSSDLSVSKGFTWCYPPTIAQLSAYSTQSTHSSNIQMLKFISSRSPAEGADELLPIRMISVHERRLLILWNLNPTSMKSSLSSFVETLPIDLKRNLNISSNLIEGWIDLDQSLSEASESIAITAIHQDPYNPGWLFIGLNDGTVRFVQFPDNDARQFLSISSFYFLDAPFRLMSETQEQEASGMNTKFKAIISIQTHSLYPGLLLVSNAFGNMAMLDIKTKCPIFFLSIDDDDSKTQIPDTLSKLIDEHQPPTMINISMLTNKLSGDQNISKSIVPSLLHVHWSSCPTGRWVVATFDNNDVVIWALDEAEMKNWKQKIKITDFDKETPKEKYLSLPPGQRKLVPYWRTTISIMPSSREFDQSLKRNSSNVVVAAIPPVFHQKALWFRTEESVTYSSANPGLLCLLQAGGCSDKGISCLWIDMSQIIDQKSKSILSKEPKHNNSYKPYLYLFWQESTIIDFSIINQHGQSPLKPPMHIPLTSNFVFKNEFGFLGLVLLPELTLAYLDSQMFASLLCTADLPFVKNVKTVIPDMHHAPRGQRLAFPAIFEGTEGAPEHYHYIIMDNPSIDKLLIRAFVDDLLATVDPNLMHKHFTSLLKRKPIACYFKDKETKGIYGNTKVPFLMKRWIQKTDPKISPDTIPDNTNDNKQEDFDKYLESKLKLQPKYSIFDDASLNITVWIDELSNEGSQTLIITTGAIGIAQPIYFMILQGKVAPIRHVTLSILQRRILIQRDETSLVYGFRWRGREARDDQIKKHGCWKVKRVFDHCSPGFQLEYIIESQSQSISDPIYCEALDYLVLQDSSSDKDNMILNMKSHSDTLVSWNDIISSPSPGHISILKAFQVSVPCKSFKPAELIPVNDDIRLNVERLSDSRISRKNIILLCAGFVDGSISFYYKLHLKDDKWVMLSQLSSSETLIKDFQHKSSSISPFISFDLLDSKLSHPKSTGSLLYIWKNDLLNESSSQSLISPYDDIEESNHSENSSDIVKYYLECSMPMGLKLFCLEISCTDDIISSSFTNASTEPLFDLNTIFTHGTILKHSESNPIWMGISWPKSVIIYSIYPDRFEFLTSIELEQEFKDIPLCDVKVNGNGNILVQDRKRQIWRIYTLFEDGDAKSLIPLIHQRPSSWITPSPCAYEKPPLRSTSALLGKVSFPSAISIHQPWKSIQAHEINLILQSKTSLHLTGDASSPQPETSGQNIAEMERSNRVKKSPGFWEKLHTRRKLRKHANNRMNSEDPTLASNLYEHESSENEEIIDKQDYDASTFRQTSNKLKERSDRLKAAEMNLGLVEDQAKLFLQQIQQSNRSK